MQVVGRPRRTSGEEAFEVLFRREFTSLVQALTLVAGEREAAADAVQDAFVQAHRHRDRVLALDSPTPRCRPRHRRPPLPRPCRPRLHPRLRRRPTWPTLRSGTATSTG